MRQTAKFDTFFNIIIIVIYDLVCIGGWEGLAVHELEYVHQSLNTCKVLTSGENVQVTAGDA